MNKLIVLALMILTNFRFGQEKLKLKDNFDYTVRTEEGDLNHDGLIDKVLVKMDTVDETQPLKLEIYFLQPNGKYKLQVSTKKLMEPQYPNGKYGGNQIPYFFIENGCLDMVSEIKDSGVNRHHFSHIFKFKNGYFELQNISNVIWDGKNSTTETNFNLLTGQKTAITKDLGSEKILKKTTQKIIVRPLPRIDDFKAFDNKLNF